MPNSRFTIVIFLSIFFISALLFFHLFLPVLTPLVFAMVLVSLFHPFFYWVLEKLNGKTVIAATLVTIIILLCVVLPVVFFIFTLSQQALEFYENASKADMLARVLDILSGNHPVVLKIRAYLSHLGINLNNNKLANSSSALAQSISLLIYENIRNIASNLLFLIFDFLIMVALVFTLFVSGGKLKNYLMEISPLPDDEKETLITQFHEISRAVFWGSGIVCLFEGIFGGLGMYWFGLGPGVFWGVVIAFAGFLPVLGTFIVVIPATVFLYIDSGPTMAIGFLAYNVIYLVILEAVVKSLVIGGRTQMNTVLVFLSVFAGIEVYGVLGLFYGPLIVTMFLSLAEIYKEHYRDNLV